MSKENVETVRRVYAALSSGDADTLRGLADRDFVVDFSRRLVEPGVMRGLDEALAFMDRNRETWDDYPFWEPRELIDAGDKVVAFVHTGARGKGSGVEVDANVWNVWTFRDGLLVEVSYFGDDRSAAMSAADLKK